MEGHYSRKEQTEDRISELEDEMEIKEKLKKYYANNSKSVKRVCKNSLQQKTKSENQGY
jgi:hypothetical protein